MSEILIELIGLVAEVLLDSSGNNRRKRNRRNRGSNKNFLSSNRSRTYSSTFEDSASSKLNGYDNSFEESVELEGPPKSYINPFATTTLDQTKVSYDSPLKETEKIVEPSNVKKNNIIKEQPVYNSQANQIKLEILLLSYMFKEDDGKISGSEKRAVKKHFSKFKGILTEDDIKEIKQFDSLDKSLINIRSFIHQNSVTEGDISDSIRTLKNIERDTDRYRSVISRIESALLETMGY